MTIFGSGTVTPHRFKKAIWSVKVLNSYVRFEMEPSVELDLFNKSVEFVHDSN